MYIIRPAQEDDAPALVALIHAAFEEYRGKLEPPSGAHNENLDAVTGMLSQEHVFVAVAQKTGEVVGCVFWVERGDAAYLHRLAVLPAWRRQGMGAALVQVVEEAARAAGFDWVTLGVRIKLPANRRFYEGLGYRITRFAPHSGYLYVTYTEMSKRIGPAVARQVVVEPWSPQWAEEYARTAEAVRRILGDDLLEIHHIGSTAVRGLAAKPIIDLLGVVRDIPTVDRHDLHMFMAGWAPRGENGIPGRRFYRKGTDALHTHHLHLFQEADPRINEHLALVAYLNAHPERAQAYGALKQELARLHPWEIDAYIAGKEAMVLELRDEALDWQRGVLAQQAPA